jgi:signal transduction histidine kinase
MIIIKYFNDAYESYINGIDNSIYINNFIDKCINSIFPNKLLYYTFSIYNINKKKELNEIYNTNCMIIKELSFNNEILGYLYICVREDLDMEENNLINLFISYLSILVYNSKNYEINVNNSSSLTKCMLNTLNNNVLITDDNLIICYLNDSTKLFLKQINDIGIDEYINHSILNYFPHLRPLLNEKFMKNKKIKLNIDSQKICIMINTVEYLKSNYNIFTFNIIETEKTNKSNNIAFLSHELRNPLQTINLATTLLIKAENLLPSQNKYIKMILQSSEEMKKIINDVLDLNKIMSNEMNLSITNINLSEFILDIVNEIEEIYQINKSDRNNDNLTKRRYSVSSMCELKYDISGNVPNFLFSDQIRLKQILMNLIINSIKYSKKSQKNKVQIHITYKDNYIYFEVEDEGVGIKEDEISKLFKCYGQTNDSVERIDSNGLGLFISQRLANLLGGEITIKSIFGKGSLFTFKHPINLSYNFNISNIFNPIININKKILIVDDVDNNSFLLKSLLQNMALKYDCDMNIETVSSGEQAVNLCKINNYDIIFMDINMGSIDGYSASKIIRDNGYKNIIIACTGNETTKLVINNYIYFDDILIKPFDDNNLLHILSKYN